MKLLRIMCVLGLALCLTTSVYAGTQSVKISGDLTVRGLYRGDYDLNRHHAEATIVGGPTTAESNQDPQTTTSDWQTWFISTAEVQVDADLTDNVSAVIRLFNQRDWNTQDPTNRTCADEGFGRIDNQWTQHTDEFNVGVDLAYIQLKEFLYSPLTLKIGRQDLWFGKGFIVGANLRDYNNMISADEYTTMRSFDAIRATLDYDPWTIDAFAAMIWENEIGSNDDETLWGVNVGYIFDTYNAEAEAYWFNKTDRGSVQPTGLKDHNVVHTVGLRGSADPIEHFTIAAEGAYQFGRFLGFKRQANRRYRSAWALDVSGECRYFKDTYAWKPVFGAEYILYTGEELNHATKQEDNLYGGWDYMYRGKFDTAYREWVGTYNFTHMGWLTQRRDYLDRFVDNSRSNQHQVLFYGNIMPIDSITVDGKLGLFWQQRYRSVEQDFLDPSVTPGGTTLVKRPKYLGAEFDLGVTWDYTEDVSFGLLAAWFWPGAFYYDQSDSTATDLVGTVKLSF